MKYLSMVCRCIEGGDCVSRWIISAISFTGFSMFGSAAMCLIRPDWCRSVRVLVRVEEVEEVLLKVDILHMSKRDFRAGS